jgi:hypothetical protein
VYTQNMRYKHPYSCRLHPVTLFARREAVPQSQVRALCARVYVLECCAFLFFLARICSLRI